MTDLTAYESALVERVARALWGADNDIGSWRVCADEAIAALSALGLLGPSRTAWLAPREATIDMVLGGFDAESWDAMRDAHLKEGGA